jgi:hypothetical protein
VFQLKKACISFPRTNSFPILVNMQVVVAVLLDKFFQVFLDLASPIVSL